MLTSNRDRISMEFDSKRHISSRRSTREAKEIDQHLRSPVELTNCLRWYATLENVDKKGGGTRMPSLGCLGNRQRLVGPMTYELTRQHPYEEILLAKASLSVYRGQLRCNCSPGLPVHKKKSDNVQTIEDAEVSSHPGEADRVYTYKVYV